MATGAVTKKARDAAVQKAVEARTAALNAHRTAEEAWLTWDRLRDEIRGAEMHKRVTEAEEDKEWEVVREAELAALQLVELEVLVKAEEKGEIAWERSIRTRAKQQMAERQAAHRNHNADR
ncbi:MAG: hypothetical protein ACYCU8_06050 [Ferrimicrobium acidiphilum]